MDQSAGMLDDDVKQKGYALLCVSTPQSDCKVRIIEEVRRNHRLVWRPLRQIVAADLAFLPACCTSLAVHVC